MIRDIIIQLTRFFLLIFSQVNIINNFNLSTYLNPNYYIFFLLMLPVNIAAPALLGAGFLTGMVMDSFMNTGGMHAMACTLLAYLRPYMLRVLLSKEQLDLIRQTDIASIGITTFLFYAGSLTFIHHFVLFLSEAFTFFEFLETIQRILYSSIVTLVLILLIHFLFFRVRPKE